jgi:NAD(P)-dependent dehydrogenase (short-subunit alcohol dehydrogenase family)
MILKMFGQVDMINNPFSLEGKTILVTGASSGIGKATSIECSKFGAKVLLLGRNSQRLEEALSECFGDGHKLIQFDLSDLDSIPNLLELLPELDGVVHSAGVNTKYLVKNVNREKIDELLFTNYYAPALITQLLLKNKKFSKNASMVFISSISSSYASVSNALYASSKGALNSFVRCLAMEIAPRGMRANVIQPGVIETPILKAYAMTDELQDFKNSCPLGHPGEPSDIALGCVYLLSNASKFTTGSILTIDGGLTLR